LAGPFKFESKPYTITVEDKAVIAAIDNTTSTGTTEPAAEVTPEATIGKVEVPTTASRGGNWIPVLVIVVIATVAAGLAIRRKKKTT